MRRNLGSYSYSDWESYYAWLPKRTIGGQWIWFKRIYQREYLFKPLYIIGKEYATIFEILKVDK